jgi:hypothetical protein
MVSTRKRNMLHGDPAPEGSAANPGDINNIDYYQHTAALASQHTFGDANDDDAVTAPQRGAYLYRHNKKKTMKLFPIDTCKDSDPHFVTNQKALDAVQKRGFTATDTKDSSPYTTRSEWFECPFFKDFLSIIANTKTANGSNKFSGLRIYLGKGKTPKHPNDDMDVFLLIPTTWDPKKKINVDDYECMKPYFSDKKDFHLYDNGELCPYYCN